MDATWQRLGDAAGTKGVGLNRVRVAPGKLPTPPHSHGASEEVYYVLGGSGLAWQDDEVHEVRPGDCVIQRANELEHTFIAGPDGLDYLVFGTRHPTDFGWLPRSGAVRFGWPWVEGRTDDPVGPRGRVAPARVRRARSATAEHPQHRRGRARALGPVDDGAARHEGALRPGRLPLGAARPGRARLGAALPLRGGGDLRHPRGRGDAPPLALAVVRLGRREGGDPDPGRPRDRTAAGDAGQPLVPGRPGRDDDADLRHAQAERHVLVPALEQDRLARARRDRADRGARVRRRRARGRRHATSRTGSARARARRGARPGRPRRRRARATRRA